MKVIPFEQHHPLHFSVHYHPIYQLLFHHSKKDKYKRYYKKMLYMNHLKNKGKKIQYSI